MKKNKIFEVMMNFLWKNLDEGEGFVTEIHGEYYIAWKEKEDVLFSKHNGEFKDDEKEMLEKNGYYLIVMEE